VGVAVEPGIVGGPVEPGIVSVAVEPGIVGGTVETVGAVTVELPMFRVVLTVLVPVVLVVMVAGSVVA
jgi:hypothetical protein